MEPTPHSLAVELTSICDCRCIGCPTGNGLVIRKPMMEMDLYRRAIEAFPYKRIYLGLWGEPALHPQLAEMIDMAVGRAQTTLATNGTHVNDDLARQIARCTDVSVSIAGVSEATYLRYHRQGNFSKAMEALQRLAEYTHGQVMWTYIVWAWNEHEMKRAAEIAEEMNVRIGFKSAYLLPGVGRATWLPKAFEKTRYGEDGALRFDRTKCPEFRTVTYVLTSGLVTGCCYDYVPEYPFGDLRTSTLSEIWHGPAYTRARQLQAEGWMHPLCMNCMAPGG